MNAPNPNTPPSPPWGWAWFATVVTLIMLFLAKVFCSRCVPEDGHDDWHLAMKAADEGVTLLGTLSLVLLTFISSPVIVTAWVAFIGFMVWSGAVLSLIVRGPSSTATVLMVAGSALILIAHLHHTSSLLTRRWARLLQKGHGKRLLALVMAMMIWVSIALAMIPPAAPHMPIAA